MIMPTQPVSQNNHTANERLGNGSDPDGSQKTKGKYSGRSVASDEGFGSPGLSHQKAETDRAELIDDKMPLNDSFGRNNIKRLDSGFESSISDTELNESIELLSLDSIDSSDSDSFSECEPEESDRSGEDGSDSESEGEDDQSVTSLMRRKNALRFSVLLTTREIELLKRKVLRNDVDYFVKCFDELKGDFFHTGDYLVEHIDELYLKLQKRFVRYSEVSIHAGQLVFWWNLLCKEAQGHLLWCERVELELLSPDFIQSVGKRKKLEKRRSVLFREYLDKDNSKTRNKAVNAQKELDNFKSAFYLPEVEKMKQRLCEMSAEEKSRQILGKCYLQLSDVLQGNVRNIVGEVDKWSRNLMLNRTFLESGLTPEDIIS